MKGADPGHWAFDLYEPSRGGSPVNRKKLTSRDKNLINGKPGPESAHTRGGGSEFSWGPTSVGKEGTRDYQTAQWAADQLKAEHEKPFFLAVGLSKPHLPFYVPQEFFDLHDSATTKANEIREDDLKDILTPSGKPKHRPTADYLWLKENGLIDECARAYLAACSYADACLGVIFEALKKSPSYDNTIVVVWGDHGWHLGEKLRYRKATGWIESTRVPLLLRMPGMKGRQDCGACVNLIDFYPTLIELCDLPSKENLDGRSFAPLLKDPTREWSHATLTIHGEGNSSITDGSWHYLRYREGTEEFYDLKNDPMEWRNLMGGELSAPALAGKERLEKLVPTKFAKGVPVQNSAEKARLKKTRALDQTIKARRRLAELK
ncbi:MAG: sulfatase-like hydrolase/transferase [Roseibacillus sp.]